MEDVTWQRYTCEATELRGKELLAAEAHMEVEDWERARDLFITLLFPARLQKYSFRAPRIGTGCPCGTSMLMGSASRTTVSRHTYIHTRQIIKNTCVSAPLRPECPKNSVSACFVYVFYFCVLVLGGCCPPDPPRRWLKPGSAVDARVARALRATRTTRARMRPRSRPRLRSRSPARPRSRSHALASALASEHAHAPVLAPTLALAATRHVVCGPAPSSQSASEREWVARTLRRLAAA